MFTFWRMHLVVHVHHVYMNAKNRTRRLESVDSDQNRLRAALLLRESQSESLGVTVSVESEQLRKNSESPSEVSMCGVSAQQWPSAQITVTLFQRTRPNAWLDAVTTPVDKKRVNPCLLKHLFLEGVQQQTNSSQNPRKRSLRHATNVTNSKFRCWNRVTTLAILIGKKIARAHVTPSTAMKFRPKLFWKWSFFDQNQQPLKSVEPFERILRALFISQCPYKFSSFLDLRHASNRFRLFLRDFRLFRFFFPGSACFSTLASPWNLPS